MRKNRCIRVSFSFVFTQVPQINIGMGRVIFIEAVIFVAFGIPARFFAAAIDTYSPKPEVEIPRQIYWQLSS